MNRPESFPIAGIVRKSDDPVFPEPWAARAYALAVTLNERGLFAWSEWSHLLSEKVADATRDDPSDAEAYWRAWLAALEEMLTRKNVAASGDLFALQEAWRHAAEATPHGQPIELPP